MTTTPFPVPNPVTAHITFDLNFSAWMIAEAKLKFCGARHHPKKSGAMCFLFDDPDQQGMLLHEEFAFGRVTANVMNFMRARTMLIEIVQGKRRGGFDEQPTR